jgi:hypothetical protein
MSTSSAAEPLSPGAQPPKAASASERGSTHLSAALVPDRRHMAAMSGADVTHDAVKAFRPGVLADASSEATDRWATTTADWAAPMGKLIWPAAGDGRAAQQRHETEGASRVTPPVTIERSRTPGDPGRTMTLLHDGQAREATDSQCEPREERHEQHDPTPGELASARQTVRRHLPPPAEVAREVAIALFEIEAGYRSAAQLERVCAPELWDRLERQVRRHGGPLPSGRKLIRVHYQELMPGVANTVAVVERGPRVQPVAMRLDARGGRWLVTELRY